MWILTIDHVLVNTDRITSIAHGASHGYEDAVVADDGKILLYMGDKRQCINVMNSITKCILHGCVLFDIPGYLGGVDRQ